jgi:hypothetical protein
LQRTAVDRDEGQSVIAQIVNKGPAVIALGQR